MAFPPMGFATALTSNCGIGSLSHDGFALGSCSRHGRSKDRHDRIKERPQRAVPYGEISMWWPHMP
jgi:hypothetical protein